MKPLDQTKFGEPEGNCLNACIASILECPLEDIPDLCDAERQGKNWLRVLNQRLAERFGLVYFTADPTKADSGFTAWWLPSGTHYVMGGKSPRPEIAAGHAVVGCDGKMVHDPHPSRAGLTEVEDYGFFIKLFP